MANTGPGPRAPFVLGVDLDGVCGDYTARFRRVVAAERGTDGSELGEPTDYEFSNWGIRTRDQFEALLRAGVTKHRMYTDMEVMAGAHETLWRLSEELGVSLRIITYRLCIPGLHGIAAGDTVEWLENNAIPHKDLCFMRDKVAVGADCYLDDSPGNIEALQGAGKATIVFDQPYNRHVAGPRAHNWADVYRLVQELIANPAPRTSG